MKRISLAIVLILALASPAYAASSTAGDATPNFTESSSCGAYGMRGPLSPGNTLGDRVYGPFADYFGRNYGQVSASVVDWMEPSGHPTGCTRGPLPPSRTLRRGSAHPAPGTR